ncbi:Putative membrane insertase YidC/ALB3/OXA1/COX18 [Colletotrichum destructivum]|uniref:Membrane insertase YidC/ALB3/OXA1/COX18 n=1 Tax=Colletotrichum destructivum TaxID=34406 RepID=A0AAX4IDZ8_9PEZI|nr:Putative membrane insertase YidC/ALB3/OXA1/COX18 [Colletotrichum destructivum]
MASLRAARCAFAPGLRQPLGFSAASSLSRSASLRPTLSSMAPVVSQRPRGVRNLAMGAYVESSIHATGNALIWLNSLHPTGHWGTTIIFAAFAVAIVRTPLQMIAKHIINKQTEIVPMLNAWRFQLRSSNRLKETLQMARTRKRILKDRGCQDWKAWAPVLGIPFWFLMSETLRRLCGAHGGWLSLLSPNRQKTTVPATDAAASVSEQASAALSSPAEAVSDGLQSLSSTVEAGMANGGMLWFTDLTVADTTMLLPGMLMLTMGYTVFPKQEEMRKLVFDFGDFQAYMTSGLKWRIRLQRALLVSALIVPTLCSNLPAGLFVYWISSMVFGQVSSRVVDRVFPRPDTIKPCRKTERFLIESKTNQV